MSLSLVLPCYNEEANIERTIAKTDEWLSAADIKGEIIAVNDGSKDKTLSVLRRLEKKMPNLTVVHHERNQGYGAAIRSGCDVSTMESIGFMDSDGQFDPSDLGKLLPHLHEVPFVVGVRTRRADPLPRILNAKMYAFLVRYALGVRVRDLNCGMKVFTKEVWEQIRPRHATGALFNAEIFLAAKEHRIRWKEVPVPHYPRQHGQPTGANLGVIAKMFRELAALRRSRNEMRKKMALLDAARMQYEAQPAVD